MVSGSDVCLREWIHSATTSGDAGPGGASVVFFVHSVKQTSAFRLLSIPLQ